MGAVDNLRGFTLAVVPNGGAFCFCDYDHDSILPPGDFASVGKGQGPVEGSEGDENNFCFRYSPPAVSDYTR